MRSLKPPVSKGTKIVTGFVGKLCAMPIEAVPRPVAAIPTATASRVRVCLFWGFLMLLSLWWDNKRMYTNSMSELTILLAEGFYPRENTECVRLPILVEACLIIKN
jgi:hypothetical protein